ncbi:hypothetical protein SAMN05421810_105194 [Amycolatopsis arida]|uniref:PIN domain-containing protein n=1 Tax=Amycolatopsis arida TaxID=587909 RepID=A0A1I5WNK1_9PSEU|nr:hypothetical protein CLV69_105213 [Amycolatopsis arida]SFQ21289.1 hypothetical protein SAMN05421810_105194 [Amycolatopsis arida]
MLDTSVFIDLAFLDPTALPVFPEITTVTLAELHQGVAMARDSHTKAARIEQLGAAIASFDALPFDKPAAARYGTLVALTIEAKRDPRPRRMDLMIAAVASCHDLPLYTRNPTDFRGLDSAVRVVAV